MKSQKMLALTLLVISIPLTACGPSQVQLDATASQAALDISSTQTAQAPTFTATSAPTLTPTITPTPTATSTPLPTHTPTVTSTPQPALMAVAPSEESFPDGFVEAPPEFVQDSLSTMPDGTYVFVYADEVNAQAIFGFLIPVKDRVEQASYDAAMPAMVEAFLASVGAGPDFENLVGLTEFGDSNAGLSAVSPDPVLPMRWDAFALRRGEVLALLIICYPGGDEPLMSMFDFATLMDGRIQAYLTAGNVY